MKKLTKYQLQKVSKNLDKYFNLASDADIADGLNWYKDANEFCKDTAKKYDVAPELVASVVSALSPRNRWATNLENTLTVLDAVKAGKGPESVKVSTFHTNKFKAFEIARGLTDIKRESRKTYSFVRNVGALDESRVTVDVWHLRACFDRTIETGVGKIAYDQLEALTIRKAKQLGLKGFEYQAIIWVSAQNNF